MISFHSKAEPALLGEKKVIYKNAWRMLSQGWFSDKVKGLELWTEGSFLGKRKDFYREDQLPWLEY